MTLMKELNGVGFTIFDAVFTRGHGLESELEKDTGGGACVS